MLSTATDTEDLPAEVFNSDCTANLEYQWP